MINTLLAHKLENDSKYRVISYLNEKRLREIYDSYTLRGFTIFRNLLRYLNENHFSTGMRNNGNVVLALKEDREDSVDLVELCGAIEENIRWFIDILTPFDKPRIKLYEFWLNEEIFESLLRNCDKAIQLNENNIPNAYKDLDFLIFLSVCKLFNIEDIEIFKTRIVECYEIYKKSPPAEQ